MPTRKVRRSGGQKLQLRGASFLIFLTACPPAVSAQRVTVPFGTNALEVPAGFTIALYHDSLPGARSLALGPGGVPYVVQSRAGRVVRLPDANGDGRADTVIVVAQGLNRPFGITFRGDTMYIGETNRVVRFLPGSSEPQVVVPTLPAGQGHWTRPLAFGRDGKLYVSVGSSCNICDETDRRRAAILRYNPDGSGEEIFATGLRNSVGLAFHPTTGELWATNNDRDMLGDDLPPERINIIRQGRNYGWPQCYLPGTRNPEYPTADCGNVEAPAITFQAHSAPLGIVFYTGTRFPAEYRGDAFIAQHGSWNRSSKVGYQVARVRVQDGRPVALEPFITGFLPQGSQTAWERPVDLLVLPDGSMLVTTDAPGRVFRVRYTGR
jgi:glucose/arabinose dehydrogenase